MGRFTPRLGYTSLALAIAAGFTTTRARAQSLQPCPARCLAPPGAYYHGGFYARIGFGIGVGSLLGRGPSGAASITGEGVFGGVAVGGTPWKGLVVAGTFAWQTTTGPFEGGPPGATGNASTFIPLLGVLVDWFPSPTGGWHAGAGFGLGGYSIEDYSHRESTAVAAAGSLFGGYDFWIGPKYALGYALVASGSAKASAEDSENALTGYRFATIAITAQVSLLYH